MTEHSSTANAGLPTPEDFAMLREIEVAWLMNNLSDAIANLGYPVGCGISPSVGHLKHAAETLFERYARMIEMAHGVAAHAQLQPDPALTPNNFLDDVLSACDASNWDADRNTGDYYKGLRDAYETVHEIANEYQTSIYAWTTAFPSTEHGAPALSKHNEFNPEREYPGNYGSTPESSR